MKKEIGKRQKGITLVALVVTIIIIIILSTVAINYLFGENGLITKTQQASEMSKIESVREKLEMAKGTAVIDGKGYIDAEHYFDILYEEGIIGDRENDVIDNGDGTYEITTVEGYIFIITLLPTPEKAKDIEIEYSGTAEGPRIAKIDTTWTTNSISIEVEARNAEDGTYTYWYKLTNEEEWKQAEQSKNNTCTIEELKEGETYDIRVMVETSEGSITREKTSVHLGELPEGTITFGEVEWKGDGTASVIVNTSAEGYQLQYQINAVEPNGWTDINNGGTIDSLTYPSTVYARIFDGINGSEYASETLEDKIAPVVIVSPQGTPTSNSVAVSTTATDAQSGMKDSLTYTYSIKVTGQADSTYTTPGNAQSITANSYTFTGLTQGTNYTVMVQVNGDKAENIGTGILENQITGSIPGGEGSVVEGAITFGNTTWGSNNKASITVNTNTSYRIEYQVNTVTEGSWQPITSGGTIGNLNYSDTVYARLTDGTNHGDYASCNVQDLTKPSIPTITLTGTNGSNGWYKSNVTVTITAGSDNESGASKIKYSVSGAQTIAETTTVDGITSENVTISADGTSTITAYTIDKAGNVSEVTTQAINKDATAPTANITVGTKTENSIGVTVSASDGQSGIATEGTYKYYLNSEGAPRETSTNNSYTYSGLSSGTSYTLKVVVTDKAGNEYTATASASTEAGNISTTNSYVGYYADIDGSGSVDGVIYADLAVGNTGDGQWTDSNGNYTIPVKTNLKNYTISKKNHTDDFGTKDVIAPISGQSGKNERFYVMALDDIDGKQNGTDYSWYYAAYGNMNDYSTATSEIFGTGKANTNTMISKWNNSSYGAKDDGDMWGIIQDKVSAGWFVPSKAEWSAFAEELGITKSNYSTTYRLSKYYWSSSQRSTSFAWQIQYPDNYVTARGVMVQSCVRLNATF